MLQGEGTGGRACASRLAVLPVLRPREGLCTTKHGPVPHACPFRRVDRQSLALNTVSLAQQGALTSVAFAAGAPDAVATASTDGSVCVWSLQVGACVLVLTWIRMATAFAARGISWRCQPANAAGRGCLGNGTPLASCAEIQMQRSWR